MTKVLVAPSTFADHDPAPLERLRAAGLEVVRNPFGRKLSKSELLQLLPGVTGLIAGLEPLSRDVLEQSTLKVISRCGAGMSNVDLAAARELGISVHSTPDAPTLAVAELTLAAILDLLRHVVEMDRELREGRWNKRIGAQLTGKTVAIVGLGRIGRKLAALLAPFEVRLLAVDPVCALPPPGIELVSLEAALAAADVVTLHASGEQQIIGRRELELMKPEAIVLNAGRGGLIGEDALADALEKGRIAGAWIDTFVEEPYSGPLRQFPNVLLTPHAGSASRECRLRMEIEAVDNLLAVLRQA